MYFLLAPRVRRIKIGVTTGFAERLRGITNQEADDIKVLGTILGDTDKERALHSEVEPYRAHNEWFDATPEVVILVARELSSDDPVRAAELEKQILSLIVR